MCKYVLMWQSHVEIDYHSIVYFDPVTALYKHYLWIASNVLCKCNSYWYKYTSHMSLDLSRSSEIYAELNWSLILNEHKYNIMIQSRGKTYSLQLCHCVNSLWRVSYLYYLLFPSPLQKSVRDYAHNHNSLIIALYSLKCEKKYQVYSLALSPV